MSISSDLQKIELINVEIASLMRAISHDLQKLCDTIASVSEIAHVTKKDADTKHVYSDPVDEKFSVNTKTELELETSKEYRYIRLLTKAADAYEMGLIDIGDQLMTQASKLKSSPS